MLSATGERSENGLHVQILSSEEKSVLEKFGGLALSGCSQVRELFKDGWQFAGAKNAVGPGAKVRALIEDARGVIGRRGLASIGDARPQLLNTDQLSTLFACSERGLNALPLHERLEYVMFFARSLGSGGEPLGVYRSAPEEVSSPSYTLASSTEMATAPRFYLGLMVIAERCRAELEGSLPEPLSSRIDALTSAVCEVIDSSWSSRSWANPDSLDWRTMRQELESLKSQRVTASVGRLAESYQSFLDETRSKALEQLKTKVGADGSEIDDNQEGLLPDFFHELPKNFIANAEIVSEAMMYLSRGIAREDDTTALVWLEECYPLSQMWRCLAPEEQTRVPEGTRIEFLRASDRMVFGNQESPSDRLYSTFLHARDVATYRDFSQALEWLDGLVTGVPYDKARVCSFKALRYLLSHNPDVARAGLRSFAVAEMPQIHRTAIAVLRNGGQCLALKEVLCAQGSAHALPGAGDELVSEQDSFRDLLFEVFVERAHDPRGLFDDDRLALQWFESATLSDNLTEDQRSNLAFAWACYRDVNRLKSVVMGNGSNALEPGMVLRHAWAARDLVTVDFIHTTLGQERNAGAFEQTMQDVLEAIARSDPASEITDLLNWILCADDYMKTGHLLGRVAVLNRFDLELEQQFVAVFELQDAQSGAKTRVARTNPGSTLPRDFLAEFNAELKTRGLVPNSSASAIRHGFELVGASFYSVSKSGVAPGFQIIEIPFSDLDPQIFRQRRMNREEATNWLVSVLQSAFPDLTFNSI